MSMVDWLVLLGSITAIVLVNWYFFLAGRNTVVLAKASASPSSEAGAPASAEPMAEVTITVHGGYDPRVVRTKAGVPVRLVFDRQESSSCSEEVVFPDFGIRKFLPAFETTTIELTPPAPGRYAFTCGMSMLRGELVAEA